MKPKSLYLAMFALFPLFLSTNSLANQWPGTAWEMKSPPAVASTTSGDLYLPIIRGATQSFSYVIDNNLTPSQTSLPGLNGGAPRMVAAAVGPDGVRSEFVVDEVVFRPKNQAELDAFLATYGGTALRDGTPIIISDAQTDPNPLPESSGLYLIRVDLSRSSLDDFTTSMEAAGVGGQFTFSSEAAARLMALIARETAQQLSPNLLLQSDAVLEHPDGSGGNLDAATWAWMTEDDDPNTPGDQGLSIGVIHAWEYLAYLGFPPTEGVWTPPIVAIIDGGFALDETTGVPLNNNIDYFYYGTKPYQADLIDYDGTAGGINPMTCTGGTPCPWHGQGAFGVAAARPRNLYGSAGTGGPVAVPMLFKVDSSFYSVADAIRSAAINGADVISLSLGGECAVWDWLCATPPDDIFDALQQAILFAKSSGAVVVAAAGNDGKNISNTNVIPCKLNGVICVGAVNGNGQAASFSNYGTGVDIWAPTNILSTVAPHTAAQDTNDEGMDELYLFGGTSASTPFVAGIVALMKTLDSALTVESVQQILQDTANLSSDAKVTPGYVDAYRAVAQVQLNQPPAVSVTSPDDGAAVSWKSGLYLRAQVIDPESPELFEGEVTFTSDLDGTLCMGIGGGIDFGCTAPALSVGMHSITARATDPFGATGSDTITLNVINQAPTATITYPPANSTFYTSQVINFRGYGFDFDETIPDDHLVWVSDIDGQLGTGPDIDVSLSQGTHTISLTATDAFGLTGQDTIQVNVQAGAGHPTAKILQPENNDFFSPDTIIIFEGQGTDPEDGTLAGEQLRWSSDRDGFLGTGMYIEVQLSGPASPCNPETIQHIITLEATDSDGNKATHQISVTIGRIC